MTAAARRQRWHAARLDISHLFWYNGKKDDGEAERMTEERQKWLGITYTAPAKPSKARVYIWRKLKELGAEYYHGMAMIPQSPKTLDSVKKLAARMRELGAEVSVLEMRFLDPRDEEKVVAQVKRQAENDFRELFLDFARLYEELGTPLDPAEDRHRILRRRYGKVKSRDFFDVEQELDLSGGLAQLVDDIHLSAGDLYRQFIALFSEK